MRGKKAKALRRIAREVTVGLPERQLLQKQIPGKTTGTVRPGWVYNSPKSTRGVYRALKKEAKRRRVSA
jgi:hypothetical protein